MGTLVLVSSYALQDYVNHDHALINVYMNLQVQLSLAREIISRLPITRMRNRDRYRKSMRGVSGFEEEESKR